MSIVLFIEGDANPKYFLPSLLAERGFRQTSFDGIGREVADCAILVFRAQVGMQRPLRWAVKAKHAFNPARHERRTQGLIAVPNGLVRFQATL